MAGHIPEELVEEVRKANDIVDVVGEHVSLKKKGRNYFGLCPFHGENTPSFSVTQDKQIYHCFGCGKGGNVFNFLMELEGFNFHQAVEYLANKSGIVLPESVSNQHNQQNNRVDQESLNAYEFLTMFYHHSLVHANGAEEAKNYLSERGLTEETMKKFAIGFAPYKSDVTTTLLEKKSFRLNHLAHTGVLSETEDGKVLDRFRGRVVFPIRNHLGKTVGFGGRTISNEEPKYLNSPESKLFQKGKLLYNFDQARSEMKKFNQAIVFEGYMDVVTADQYGIYHGVASLGTALTDHQAQLLKRYVDEVIICYDGDHAGIEAAFKAAGRLKNAGLHARIATIPNGDDPDGYLRTYGAEAFTQKILDQSATYMSFVLSYLKRQYDTSIEASRMQYIDEAIRYIATLTKPIEREHYVRELANEYNLSVDTIMEEVEQSRKKVIPEEKPRVAKHKSRQKQQRLYPAYFNAERKLISYMLYDATIAERMKHRLGASFNVDVHKVIVTHLYAYYEAGYPADVSQFIERIDDQEVKNLIIELAMQSISPEVSEEEINDYVYMIQREQGDKALVKELIYQQKQAEKDKDIEKAVELGMEIFKVKKRLQDALRE